MTLSSTLRRVSKYSVLPLGAGTAVRQSFRPALLILAYHKVAGDTSLQLDLAPDVFRRQLNYIARNLPVVSLDEALLAPLEGGVKVVLTFDDGYADFITNAFPVLQELKLPSVLYVSTRHVAAGEPLLFSGARTPGNLSACRPLLPEDVSRLADSGLVTIGAHTHSHLSCQFTPPDILSHDIERSLELIRAWTGRTARHFAYPYGHWSPRGEEVVARYFESAMLGGSAPNFRINPLRLLRVPVQQSDDWLLFQARIRGWLGGEELLRRGRNALRATGRARSLSHGDGVAEARGGAR